VINDIAKNLLENKTCNQCDNYSLCSNLRYHSQYDTCEKWEPNSILKLVNITKKPTRLRWISYINKLF